MSFIVILIALLIERFFDWSHLRQWKWFAAYQHAIIQRFPNTSSYFSLAIVMLPLIAVVAFFHVIASHIFFGFGELLFDLVILLYCLGPRNLWADAFAAINTLVHGDNYAADKIKASMSMSDTSYSRSQRKHFLDSIFSEANTRVFAIVFWFAVLGPVGAVLYRLINLESTEAKQERELTSVARSVEGALDWVPVRIFTFLFALGGHFAQVLAVWRKNALLGVSSNDMLLEECGNAALGSNEQKIGQDGSLERNAISLLDRSFVIMLVVLLVLVFVV